MDIIRVCRPDPTRSIYILGGLSYRVSLHTQQHRVIRLIDRVAGELDENADVAVIGGGVAGVTCAAALAAKGMRVSLFEQAGGLMPLQCKNTTRFIHPNSVTWPYSGMGCSTNLPFLNWHSAYSDEVAALIGDEFRSDFVGRGGDEINLELNSRVTDIIAFGNEHEVRYVADGAELTNRYKAVFITTGFGRERKISGYDNFSYWEDTSPTPIGSAYDNIHIAVIGDGDGALLELVRCLWGDVNLDELYRFLADKFLKDRSVVERTKAAEEKARGEMRNDVATACNTLGEHYLSENLSPNGKKYLRSRQTATARITLVTRELQPFNPRASPIHKLLLGFLIRESLIDVAQCSADSVSYENDRYMIHGTVGDVPAAPLGPFDRVLERLGPERKFCPLVRKTFDSAVLDTFGPVNAVEFDFANPILLEPFTPDMLKPGPNAARQPIEIARDKLERYFRNNYPNVLSDLSVGKTEDAKKEPCLVASYNLGNDDLKKDAPQQYLGYKIDYRRSDTTPRALSGRIGDMDGGLKTRTDPITASQPITNLSRLELQTAGQITAFIKPIDSVRDHGEAYFITAAHALLARPNDKIAIVEGAETRRIGRIDTKRFVDILSRWQHDPDYVSLKDVAVVRIDCDVETENRAGSNLIERTRSSLKHFLFDDGLVYVKGKAFGYIERARASATILDPEGHPIRTQGFFIRKTDPAVDVTAGSSGRPVFTATGELVGMIVAGDREVVFCLDMEEVLEKMGCVLA